MYGGTYDMTIQRVDQEGLSPRVRGNRIAMPALPSLGRSIPACTGEPSKWPSTSYRCQVYPRVYGGTMSSTLPPFLAAGLSPRVRGNRQQLESPSVPRRSIPACTGEPGSWAKWSRRLQVYPRVYGGTNQISRGFRL